jgi:hypothetical protein
MTDQLRNEIPRYPGTYPADTGAFIAADNEDPRDAAQPSPGDPGAVERIGDPTTLVPLREIEPYNPRPLAVSQPDHGIAEVVWSLYDTSGVYTGTNWLPVGIRPPANGSHRKYKWKLQLNWSGGALLFVPYNVSPVSPGADRSRAYIWDYSDLGTGDGLLGGWVQTITGSIPLADFSASILGMLTRTRFDP